MADRISGELVNYLLNCTEARYALIRIGIDLNDLKLNRQFTDDQLKAFLNEVRQAVQREKADRVPLETICQWIGRYDAMLR